MHGKRTKIFARLPSCEPETDVVVLGQALGIEGYAMSPISSSAVMARRLAMARPRRWAPDLPGASRTTMSLARSLGNLRPDNARSANSGAAAAQGSRLGGWIQILAIHDECWDSLARLQPGQHVFRSRGMKPANSMPERCSNWKMASSTLLRQSALLVGQGVRRPPL